MKFSSPQGEREKSESGLVHLKGTLIVKNGEFMLGHPGGLSTCMRDWLGHGFHLITSHRGEIMMAKDHIFSSHLYPHSRMIAKFLSNFQDIVQTWEERKKMILQLIKHVLLKTNQKSEIDSIYSKVNDLLLISLLLLHQTEMKFRVISKNKLQKV